MPQSKRIAKKRCPPNTKMQMHNIHQTVQSQNKFYGNNKAFMLFIIGLIALFILRNLYYTDKQTSNMQNNKEFNFASKYLGGRVVQVLSTSSYFPPANSVLEKVNNIRRMIFGCSDITRANQILNPIVYPGTCWPFKGSKGVIILKLARPIKVTGMTLKHISGNEINEHITSAPKNLIISGLKSHNDSNGFKFGNIKYRLNRSPDQYFDFRNCSPDSYEYIKINVTSNWGNDKYTCMYAIEIYGNIN